MFQNLCNQDKCYRNLIGGQWVESSSGNSIEIHSPIDGSLVGCIPAMTREEADAAIQNTIDCRKVWAHTPVYERANIFNKAASILEDCAEELAEVLIMEIAKDRKSSLAEIQRSADFLRYTADAGRGMEGQAISGENFPGGSRNKMSYVTRVPLGTVLAISPFNYPVNLSMSKIAPALIGGNAVVLKPPTQGAISALHLAEVFQQAGLPAGVLNTVTGRGGEIGDYIVSHPGIDFINFTGSTDVGRHIAKIAGMVPLLLEMGGKDAAIVLPDADLDFAAENIVAGGYSYSGQRCTAVKRILVLESVADVLVEKLKRNIGKLKIGDPHDAVDIVPLISEEAVAFVQELIDDALQKGASPVTCNKTDGNLMHPLLLDRVGTDMRIAWEEPFGPVLPVLRVKTVEDAISIANRSEYGLQSSVFTHNINDAFYIANRLEVGTVQINNKTERGPDHFPFLGVKSSGLGTQGVKYSIEAMTRPKAVVVNLEDAENAEKK
ncbi:NADP-dependent glyceraldehyde-3-phosphate dehydrogenase [Oscillospiraceae bacterium PP1C4]